MSAQQTTSASPHPSIARFLRDHAYLVLLCVVFSALGVWFALWFFPELSYPRAIAGGVVFGLFGVLCAGCHSVIWKS